MKPTLLYPGGENVSPMVNGDTAFDDLGMDPVFTAMAGGDPIIEHAARTTLAAGTCDPAVIAHRHAVLADCCAHPRSVREVHAVAGEAIGIRRWSASGRRRPNGKLLLTLAPFTEALDVLRRLRLLLADAEFTAPGWTELAAMTARFDDTYLHTVRTELAALAFDHGIEFDAGLGAGNTIAHTVLRPPPRPRRPRIGFGRAATAFEAIEDGDPNSDPVMQLRNQALAAVADIVAAASDRLHEFFARLRTETAFYLGCLTLRERLDAAGIDYCLPRAHPPGTSGPHARGLRDITLSLSGASRVTGNDIDARGRSLIVITGANNGGKSTFLRSLGAAQLMMQAGMFVLASDFAADVRDGVFTHFVSDEDRSLSHGKLVDELVRMNTTVQRVRAHGLLLCNEAFASTGERDATRIAGPLVAALTESGVRVVFVTHLYDYARDRYDTGCGTDLFLRAERDPDGTRTHRMVAGAPQAGGHGDDMFRRVFDRPPDPLTRSGADCSAL